MLPVLQFIAILASTSFASAVIYINLVEHPARMGLPTQVAATVWAPNYRRATRMQASLAIIGFLSSTGAWLSGAGAMWLVAALILLAVVPVTLLVIAPVNRQLLVPGRNLAAPATRALLVNWGQLHTIRSVLGVISASMLVWLAVAT